MKVKIFKNPTEGWSLLKEKYDVDMVDELLKQIEADSLGSDIEIINGSFSQIKPIQNEINNGGASSSNDFKPTVSSTPLTEYDGQPKKEDNSISSDLTFNSQKYVIEEQRSCEEYMSNLSKFIMTTQNMVKEKIVKKSLLERKLKKYQKKIKNLEITLNALDRMITFGTKVPQLLDNI